MTKFLQVVTSKVFIGLACLLLGAAVILGIRFVMYKPPEEVHYHANFALYINGQREAFKGDANYSETEMCAANTAMSPEERAHMHDHVNNVVHVEDHAVTWGQFFANLRFTIGPDMVEVPDGTVYAENGSAKLHVILNGQDLTGLSNISNTVVKDQDRLLISYGDETDAELQHQYTAIPATAHKYDTAPDPKSCSGAKAVTQRDRLRHLF